MARLGLAVILLISMVGCSFAGEWNANNFTALWKACEKGSPSLFAKELGKLRERFSDQADSMPRKDGVFIDEEFAETGEILFPSRLPDDYPFRESYKECWVPLFVLEKQIEGNSSARPREDARRWQNCIGSDYRDTPPLVARKLRQCLIQLHLLPPKK